ncbi:MAG: hypothetical protein ACUVRO_14590, partial [Armatimonadota bacterium]
EAARETAELIEESVRRAGEGVTASERVLSSLTEINERANRVSQVMIEIVSAAEQQEMGISQVTTAMEQVSQVTQQVAANSQESAATAEELSGQAEELRALVGEFRLSGDNIVSAGGRAAHNRPRRSLSTAAGAGFGVSQTRDNDADSAPVTTAM